MPDDPGHIARTKVEDAVLAYLRAQHGPDAVVLRPISPTLSMTTPTPADWRTGIIAARHIGRTVEILVEQWARKARAEGISWRDLAGPLGVPEDADDPGREAWFLLAEPPSMPHDPQYFYWSCPSCGQHITDYGPLSGDPTETEEGHADDCARHQAEIAAYVEWVNS